MNDNALNDFLRAVLKEQIRRNEERDRAWRIFLENFEPNGESTKKSVRLSVFQKVLSDSLGVPNSINLRKLSVQALEGRGVHVRVSESIKKIAGWRQKTT